MGLSIRVYIYIKITILYIYIHSIYIYTQYKYIYIYTQYIYIMYIQYISGSTSFPSSQGRVLSMTLQCFSRQQRKAHHLQKGLELAREVRCCRWFSMDQFMHGDALPVVPGIVNQFIQPITCSPNSDFLERKSQNPIRISRS